MGSYFSKREIQAPPDEPAAPRRPAREVGPELAAAAARFRTARRAAAAALVRRCLPALPEAIRGLVVGLLLCTDDAFARALFPAGAPPARNPYGRWNIIWRPPLCVSVVYGVVCSAQAAEEAYINLPLTSIRDLYDMDTLSGRLVSQMGMRPRYEPLIRDAARRTLTGLVGARLDSWPSGGQ